MLCELQQPDADAAAGSAADAAAHGVMDAAADGGAGASQLEQRLPHTYDDGDLYEQLLKEFLEGSGAPGGGGVLLQRVSRDSCSFSMFHKEMSLRLATQTERDNGDLYEQLSKEFLGGSRG